MIFRDINFVDNYKIKGNYIVSENGVIIDRKEEKKLKQFTKKSGYMYVRLPIKKRDIIRNFYVHRVVLNIYEPIENSRNYVVDHIDLNRSNNKLENLRWLTQKENIQHSIDMGTFTQHKDQGVLKDKEVHNICLRLEKGENPIDIISDYNDKVKLTTIQKIKTGSIHKKIYKEYNIEHRKNKYKYNWKEFVEPVCELLEKNYTTREIADELEFDTSETLERQKFWKFVKRIKERTTYNDISKKYNF